METNSFNLREEENLEVLRGSMLEFKLNNIRLLKSSLFSLYLSFFGKSIIYLIP